MSENVNKTGKWLLPADIMKLHKLKLKKKALQARINNTKKPCPATSSDKNTNTAFDDVLTAKKRKNPFIKNNTDTTLLCLNKRCKIDSDSSTGSEDKTLFKIFNNSVSSTINENDSFASLNFKNLLSRLDNKENDNQSIDKKVELVRAAGEKHPPIDWSLKTKIRLLANKPFPWSSKLKINEESSGVTAFVRCLSNSNATLDNSPNAKFHQCCQYWQQPALPWLQLFPRCCSSSRKSIGNNNNNNSIINLGTNATVRDSLQQAFADSLRSLFQLLRTRQCPFFYACGNNFTVLFRAAGIAGFADIHAIVTPSTRGFRQLLKQEDIEFTMPLKTKLPNADLGYCDNNAFESVADGAASAASDDDDEKNNEQWLKSLGCNVDDIKQINRNQAQITHKSECEIDNTDQSLVLIEGVEVHGFYNFLLNCKSTTATTGAFAGIPPTLLAPVAFHGATLNSLKVRENRANLDGADYYSLELIGPILPSLLHNLFSIDSAPPQFSLTATFHNLNTTEAFSKLARGGKEGASLVFGTENLSDCGLNSEVLKRFCQPQDGATNVECLKYDCQSQSYSWT